MSEATTTNQEQQQQPPTHAQGAAEQTPTKPQTSAAEEPSWLGPRLEQAKRSAQAEILKGLGFESPEAARERLAHLVKLEEASLSDAERTAKRIAELEPLATRAQSLEATVKQYAERELSGLTEQQRAAVAAIAGEDHGSILRTIESLRPTWATSTPAQPQAPDPPPPASTTAAPPSPQQASANLSEIDHKSKYNELRKTNPFEAARYLTRHRNAILG